MMGYLRGFDRQINSPCGYQRECMKKSMENIDSDVKVIYGFVLL